MTAESKLYDQTFVFRKFICRVFHLTAFWLTTTFPRLSGPYPAFLSTAGMWLRSFYAIVSMHKIMVTNHGQNRQPRLCIVGVKTKRPTNAFTVSLKSDDEGLFKIKCDTWCLNNIPCVSEVIELLHLNTDESCAICHCKVPSVEK